ncbi:MAG: hypothetical protein LQ348_001065 [Seirophora lacunosa]|nr:MAG: hypothetical protein LQ348_001065 [Seirophora lacunosa]
MTIKEWNVRWDQRQKQETAQFFSVNGARYVALPPFKVRISQSPSGVGLIRDYKPYIGIQEASEYFVTVINVAPETRVTEEWLRKKLASYRSTDDVFCDEFLTGVLVTGIPAEESRISPGARHYMESIGITYEIIPDALSPGPYLAGSIRHEHSSQQRFASPSRRAQSPSFAATEEPLECVDYQAPWNPRANGHQSPAGSSSGSGAAIASYSWLDIAIGSDTSGSGRRPGHWNGCFAMRPSHGVLPVDGYTASFRQFDVPTFFGRDVAKCKAFASEWYGDLLPEVKILPPRIIYPLDYMSLISNKDQLQLIDQFVVDLEVVMGIKQEKVTLTSLWDSSPPAEAGGQSLDEYMKHACRDSFFHDDYHNFGCFRQEYQNKFSKTPYVSPPVRWQWDLATKITQRAIDTAVEKLAVYRTWFCNIVMGEDEHNSIVILPIENMSPRYRDEARTHFDPIGPVSMLSVFHDVSQPSCKRSFIAHSCKLVPKSPITSLHLAGRAAPERALERDYQAAE